MSENAPIYSGEAVLLNWHDAKSGRKIVLQLEKYAPGAHPFDGLDGERFAVVIVGPLAPAEHGQVARKGSKTVPIAQSESAAPPGAAEVDGSAPSRHAKPKRHWRDMPPSQRAALFVKDKGVWEYITEAFGIVCQSEDVADRWLKNRLHVLSKSELDTDAPAARHFDLLSGKFRAWQQARGHGVI